MKVSPKIREALSRRDMEAVEAAWLVRQSEDPTDLSFFAAVAESLTVSGEANRARLLLELLDEQLAGARTFETRLELIRIAGRHYLKAGRVFDTVLESVRGLYADRTDHLAEALRAVGLDRGREETSHLWDKVERLKNLLAYQVGTIVAIKEHGAGRVAEVNLPLQTLKVDFEKHRGFPVGLRAAAKVLEILPEEPVLRQKLERPAALRELAPPELLRITLTSYHRPLTASEIREVLGGIVAESAWTSWWAAARKHPQVLPAGDKRQAYRWERSGEAVEQTLWEAFAGTDVRGKLEQLRRATGQGALRERMVRELETAVAAIETSDPALAFEAWQALDRAGAAAAARSLRGLVERAANPLDLARNLGTRSQRERAYQLVCEVRSDGAEALVPAVLSEEEPKALDLLLDLLRARSEELAARALELAALSMHKAPAAFTWLLERAADDESVRTLFRARLFRLTLQALADDTFAAFRTRLAAQADTGGALPRILSLLDRDEAQEIEAALAAAESLEDYRRTPLRNALYVRFPELRGEQESPLYATAAAYQAKQKELLELLEVEIPANRRAIEEARAMGDLRENFEYKSARQRHEYLSARATHLKGEISRARVLDPAQIETREVRVGTRLNLRAGDGRERTLTILGPWESRPEDGIVSYESEFAQQILGRIAGDSVRLDEETFEITRIEPWTAP